MELKDIVCSLEYAKNLEELGIKQDSLFYHCKEKGFGSPFNVIKDRNIASQGYNQHMSIHKIASAFTSDELGRMLPKEIKIENICYYLEIAMGNTNNSKWLIMYNASYENRSKQLYYTKEKKEADARAKMLIHLIKNNLIKVSNINEKIK